MRIALITHAWQPQVNGVATTLGRCRDEIRRRGHHVEVLHPGLERTLPCPRYPQIRLAVRPGAGVRRRLDTLEPDAVHIATEGPLGVAARSYCRRRKLPFTTSFHTQLALYARVYLGIP